MRYLPLIIFLFGCDLPKCEMHKGKVTSVGGCNSSGYCGVSVIDASGKTFFTDHVRYPVVGSDISFEVCKKP